jgi:hypothetical protein
VINYRCWFRSPPRFWCRVTSRLIGTKKRRKWDCGTCTPSLRAARITSGRSLLPPSKVSGKSYSKDHEWTFPATSIKGVRWVREQGPPSKFRDLKKTWSIVIFLSFFFFFWWRTIIFLQYLLIFHIMMLCHFPCFKGIWSCSLKYLNYFTGRMPFFFKSFDPEFLSNFSL